MMFRRLSLWLAKYLAIGLCLLALLLTTPFGAQFSLFLLNFSNAISVEYRGGALVRDLALHEFTLQLDDLAIELVDLESNIDFSCAWQKKLCIHSLSAEQFNLNYQSKSSDDEESLVDESAVELIELPFAISAEQVKILSSKLVINDTQLQIKQLASQVDIEASHFSFYQPSAHFLSVDLYRSATSETSISEESKDTSLDLPRVSLPMLLKVEQLSLAELLVQTVERPSERCTASCEASAEVKWHAFENALTGAWQNTQVDIRHLASSTLDFSLQKMTAKAELTPPYQLNAKLNTQLKKLDWWPNVVGDKQEIILNGALNDLTFKVINEGKLALTSSGKLDIVAADIPFDIQLVAQQVPMPLSLASHGTPSTLQASVSGDLKKQALQLSSQLSSYGYQDAEVTLDITHQQGHFKIKNLNVSEPSSASELVIHGEFLHVEDASSWQLSAQSAGLSLPETNVAELLTLLNLDSQMLLIDLPAELTGNVQGKINSSGQWEKDNWHFSLTETEISGQVNNTPISLQGNFGVNQSGQLQAGELVAEFNHSELTLVSLSSDQAKWHIQGQLTLNELHHWSQAIQGKFTSDFAITGEIDNPLISVNSEVKGLNWQQEWLADSIVIQGEYQPKKNHHLDLSVANNTLQWLAKQPILLHEAEFQVVGNANNHKVNFNWQGDYASHVELNGHFNDDFSSWHSEVAQSAISYKNVTLQNDKAFSFAADITNKQFDVSAHCWQGTGLSACLPHQISFGESGNFLVELVLDMSKVDKLMLPDDIEIESQLHGEVNTHWSPEQPLNAMAHFALSSGHIRMLDELNQFQLSQWSNGEFSFSVNEQLFSSSLLLESEDKVLMQATSSLGLTEQSPIKAQVVLKQLNLQPFQAILADVVSLQGELTADIAVEGTLNKPLVNGDVTLGKGRLLLRENANSFENITSTMRIDNNYAVMDGSFYLKDKVAKLSGTASWQDDLALNLNLQADELPFVFPPQLVMNVAPNINATLANKMLTISGNIDVLDGHYTFEKLPEGSVSLSDDVIIIDNEGKAVTHEGTGLNIKTDIRVNIADRFTIAGQGLQSKLFGDLKISQQGKQPLQLFGRIQSGEGTFQAYGQRLQIETGEITFNGPIDNPYFNLSANRHIKSEDIDVGIKITGLAEALEMELFSSPTMEMPEILSYLVRGRSLDAGTENSTVAASFLVGFGVTNSVGLFDQIEKIPLISNIAVDTEGEGEKTQATVSGYIGERIYMKYGIGVYEPINELTVRLFLLNRLWLEVVSGIEQSTDLYYSFDID